MLFHTDKRPVLRVLIGGLGFALLSTMYGQASPRAILFGSVVFAAAVAWVLYRQKKGEQALPRSAAIVLAVAMIGLYSWGFFVKARPSGAEWIAVLLLFLVPIALLWNALQRRT